MTSNRCHIDGRGQGRAQALAEAERVAAYCGLAKKDALRLRLLAEELTGLLTGLSGDYRADFWIEEEDGLFRLRLSADARLGPASKERLRAIASPGKTAAAGVMAKVASLFEVYVLGGPEVAAYIPPTYMMMGMGEFPLSETWSMQTYRNRIAASKESRPEEWDELERSIVANLADDITVGCRSNRVEIQLFKRF